MVKRKKSKKEKEPDFKVDLGMGGLFKDLGTLLDKASKLADKGEQIKELKNIGGVKDSRAVVGYNIRTLKGSKKPVVSKFGNIKETKSGPVIKKKREPLIDIFNEENEIRVVAELPGVDKKDIKLDLGEKQITISVDTKGRKYYKEVELPSSAKSMTSNYKNGVLEVRLVKKEEKEGKGPSEEGEKET